MTQIFYHEWTVAGLAERVQRVENGFKFWAVPWFPDRWIYGLKGTKLVTDASISALFRSPHVVRIRFDETDEIIVRDEVLADVDLSSLPYPVLSEFGLERSDERVLAMRFRQEKLGDVSWEFGRHGGRLRSARAVRRPKWIIGGLGLLFVATMLIFR